MRKVNDSTSKEMVVFDLELVPQGPDPENGATNTRTHKRHTPAHQTPHTRMHDMETSGRNTQDFGVRTSAGELEDNVKIVGPRGQHDGKTMSKLSGRAGNHRTPQGK